MTDDMTDVITYNHLAPGEVGVVVPRDFVYARPFTFKSGQTLPGFTLRYETYGVLNATRDNVILICHALSGDHHCAGLQTTEDRKPGWWNNLIGPGKAVDTSRFFVICANVLGGCQGSTGPSSTNPATERPYGLAWLLPKVIGHANALDVLAFVLTPVAAFASSPDEIEAVTVILGAAKCEAIERWESLRSEARRS